MHPRDLLLLRGWSAEEIAIVLRVAAPPGWEADSYRRRPQDLAAQRADLATAIDAANALRRALKLPGLSRWSMEGARIPNPIEAELEREVVALKAMRQALRPGAGATHKTANLSDARVWFFQLERLAATFRAGGAGGVWLRDPSVAELVALYRLARPAAEESDEVLSKRAQQARADARRIAAAEEPEASG